MRSNGVPCEPDYANPNADVFSFPVESPEGCITRDDMSAIDQLKLWKMYQENWCEHKPSITVYVRENEWMGVGAWVYQNFDGLSGVSFLPYDNGTYRQAPYEEITKEKFDDLTSNMPDQIDWSSFKETIDDTTVQHELACSAGACEL